MLTTASKALDGRVFVVLFALVGARAKPKRFVGLFRRRRSHWPT
jgi:hypothetical protein